MHATFNCEFTQARAEESAYNTSKKNTTRVLCYKLQYAHTLGHH